MTAVKFLALAVGATAIGWCISCLAFVGYMGITFRQVPLEDETYLSHIKEWHDKARLN